MYRFCSYCGGLLTWKYWRNIYRRTAQCERIVCVADHPVWESDWERRKTIGRHASMFV